MTDEHNWFRKQVLDGKVEGLPKAKYMSTLEWDQGLAKEAQRKELHKINAARVYKAVYITGGAICVQIMQKA